MESKNNYTALAINIGLPGQQEWLMIEKICMYGVKSSLLPSTVNTIEKAIIIALKAREIGVPTMLGFSHINVVNGKPAISSELMLSLIFRNCPGAVIEYLETSNDVCKINARRPGQTRFSTFTYSIDDAKKANLDNKDTWKKFPAAMLRARCISAMARALFPDAIMGCSYTPDELDPDAYEITEDGDVLETRVAEKIEKLIEEKKEEQRGKSLSQSLKEISNNLSIDEYYTEVAKIHIDYHNRNSSNPEKINMITGIISKTLEEKGLSGDDYDVVLNEEFRKLKEAACTS